MKNCKCNTFVGHVYIRWKTQLPRDNRCPEISLYICRNNRSTRRNPTWSWDDAGKPHGYTKQIHMYGVISWAAKPPCIRGWRETERESERETRRNGRKGGATMYTRLPGHRCRERERERANKREGMASLVSVRGFLRTRTIRLGSPRLDPPPPPPPPPSPLSTCDWSSSGEWSESANVQPKGGESAPPSS